MIENGIVYEFDRMLAYEDGKCVTVTLMPTPCYICIHAKCPHCHLIPSKSTGYDKLGLLREGNKIIRNVQVNQCSLIHRSNDGEQLTVEDILMDITTNGKQRQVYASDLIAYVWYKDGARTQ